MKPIRRDLNPHFREYDLDGGSYPSIYDPEIIRKWVYWVDYSKEFPLDSIDGNCERSLRDFKNLYLELIQELSQLLLRSAAGFLCSGEPVSRELSLYVGRRLLEIVRGKEKNMMVYWVFLSASDNNPCYSVRYSI